MNMTALAPSRKHRSLAQGVVAHLAGRIQDGSLVPGARLPTEAEMMRTLGVGRSAVREAMSHLQAGGMVETRHGVGTFVLAPPPRDVPALLELRLGLEADAAALAAQRRSDAQLAQLGAACSLYEKSATAAHETAFHLLVVESAGNRYFTDILAPLCTHHPAGAAPETARVILGHQAIYSAIARRDAECARAAMRTHLVNRCADLHCAS